MKDLRLSKNATLAAASQSWIPPHPFSSLSLQAKRIAEASARADAQRQARLQPKAKAPSAFKFQNPAKDAEARLQARLGLQGPAQVVETDPTAVRPAVPITAPAPAGPAIVPGMAYGEPARPKGRAAKRQQQAELAAAGTPLAPLKALPTAAGKSANSVLVGASQISRCWSVHTSVLYCGGFVDFRPCLQGFWSILRAYICNFHDFCYFRPVSDCFACLESCFGWPFQSVHFCPAGLLSDGRNPANGLSQPLRIWNMKGNTGTHPFVTPGLLQPAALGHGLGAGCFHE